MASWGQKEKLCTKKFSKAVWRVDKNSNLTSTVQVLWTSYTQALGCSTFRVRWSEKSGGRFQHWPSCFPWRSWITLRRDKRGILWTLTSQSLWRLKLSRRRATETMSLQIKIISISQTGLKGHSAEHPRRWCFMSWNSLFFQKVAVGVLQFHIECEHSECGKD